MTKRSYLGADVIWEVNGYAKDFEIARSSGGYFDLSHWGVVQIEGPDAEDFLQRITSADIKSLDENTTVHAALLTGKGQVVTIGFFQKTSQGYHYLLAPSQTELALEHLGKFHFTEDLAFKKADFSLVALWNSKFLGADLIPMKNVKKEGVEVFQDDLRTPLKWVKLSSGEVSKFTRNLEERGIKRLGYRLFEYFRIKAGVPVVGIEASEKHIILETNFERAVSRTKGCYPGQEVVERILTYGDVNRKLLPVIVNTNEITLPVALVQGDKKVGELMSWAVLPEDPARAVGLAYIGKKFWTATESFTTESKGIQVDLAK